MEKKNDLVLHSVLANIRRGMMETVSVLPFGKFRENRKREMMIFTSQTSSNPFKTASAVWTKHNDTVDDSEIRRSPVEVGSLSHFL